jgi:transcriptional regulator with XRE-family HTH domain
MVRAEVSPNLFRWARDRAGIPLAALTPRFSKLAEWESGTSMPTLKQLEALAKATLTPVGYFFLPEPPDEQLPLPDFRTVRDTPLSRPSPNLLAMVYACQERQSWYREFAATAGVEPCPFVGSVTTGSPCCPETHGGNCRRIAGGCAASVGRSHRQTWPRIRLLVAAIKPILLRSITGRPTDHNAPSGGRAGTFQREALR